MQNTACTAGASVTATCNLCGGGDIGVYHDQGWRRVVRCRRCLLVFVDPLPTPEQKAVIRTNLSARNEEKCTDAMLTAFMESFAPVESVSPVTM